MHRGHDAFVYQCENAECALVELVNEARSQERNASTTHSALITPCRGLSFRLTATVAALGHVVAVAHLRCSALRSNANHDACACIRLTCRVNLQQSASPRRRKLPSERVSFYRRISSHTMARRAAYQRIPALRLLKEPLKTSHCPKMRSNHPWRMHPPPADGGQDRCTCPQGPPRNET